MQGESGCKKAGRRPNRPPDGFGGRSPPAPAEPGPACGPGGLPAIGNRGKGKPLQAWQRQEAADLLIVKPAYSIGEIKKEANRLLHRIGLQLPERNTAVDLCTANIAQDAGIVNTHSMVVQIKMVEQSGNSDTSTTTDMVPQSDTAVNTHSMVNPTAFTVRCIWLTTQPKKLFAPQGAANKKTPEAPCR